MRELREFRAHHSEFAALGVAVAFGMAKVMASLFGDEINISAYVTPKSLIIPPTRASPLTQTEIE